MKASAAKCDQDRATAPTTIFVVDGDRALSYLLERYAGQSGFLFCEVHGPWQTPPAPPAGSAALWLPSIERLEAVRPRERGVDMPVIVCSFAGDEIRAHALGADLCAFHPLRYQDFLAALRAVGISDRDRASAENDTEA